ERLFAERSFERPRYRNAGGEQIFSLVISVLRPLTARQIDVLREGEAPRFTKIEEVNGEQIETADDEVRRHKLIAIWQRHKPFVARIALASPGEDVPDKL